MSDAKSIAQLEVGESATVGEMGLPEAAAARLRELGLLPGVAIRLVRRAPLGCPIEFEVGAARFALCGRDAAQIFVQ